MTIWYWQVRTRDNKYTFATGEVEGTKKDAINEAKKIIGSCVIDARQEISYEQMDYPEDE